MQRLNAWFGIAILAIGLVAVLPPEQASAVPVYVKSASAASHNTNPITATFTTGATAGNLLVAFCGSDTGTITTPPAGFTQIRYETTTRTQGVYYKISTGGETSFSCTTSSSFNGLHVHEFSGVDTLNPVMASGSATGTSASPNSGSVTTTETDALLVTGITIGGQTAFSAWNNTFTERADIAVTGGSPPSRITVGAATRIVSPTGSYSTTATAGASSAWRGQIVAFRASLTAPVLSVDIVDASGNSVVSPSASLTTATAGFDCQTVTGTVGTNEQRIRVTNTTTSPAWTVAIAATSGATGLWDSGANNYDFNDPSGTPAGCGDGADADTRPGQLTLNPSVGTTTPQTGCTTTGVTRGSGAGFNEGVSNSLTLISASSSAATNCYWDLTGISASQTIPATQPAGTYTLSLTITAVAN